MSTEYHVGATHAHANTGRSFDDLNEATVFAEQMRVAGWTVWISVRGQVEGWEYPGKPPIARPGGALSK